MDSRTKNSMRNMIVALTMQIFSVLLSFVGRTIFAKLLSAEYLGLSGLFSNIIAVLSLSELGIGSVIIVHLYKPVAENDKNKIIKLMNFYKGAYNSIGLFVIVCGVILLPFLEYFVKSDTQIPYLRLYFFMFVLQSSSSYFFAYKQSLLIAEQKEYICSVVRQTFEILMKGMQIVVLILTKKYFFYLLVSIVTSVSTNVVISHIADRKYSFIKNNKNIRLDKKEKREMMSNVSSMMLHKVGNTVINSTDNILISSLVGVIFTGLYSNYLLIMNVITQIISIILGAVSASIGNFNAQKDSKEKKILFDSLMFMSYWIFGMSAICLCCLFQPTIGLWLGEEYLLSFDIVLVISVNFFTNGIFRIPATFIDVNGLYTRTKFKPISMAIINLGVSIICLRTMGLIGVFVGTLASYLIVGLWVDPYFLCKYVFIIPLKKYFLKMSQNLILIVICGIITYCIVSIIPNYLLKVLSCGIIANMLLLLCYAKSPEFKFIVVHIKSVLHK